MSNIKDEIKTWLKDGKKNREWLADQCGVGKRTVDKWLGSERDIPDKAILIIRQLMRNPAGSDLSSIQVPLTQEDLHGLILAAQEAQLGLQEFIDKAVAALGKQATARNGRKTAQDIMADLDREFPVPEVIRSTQVTEGQESEVPKLDQKTGS